MEQPRTEEHELRRSVGLIGALGVMIGVTIGSGIFRTPASIASESGDPWFILLLWVIGGVLSLFGAFTFAELGTMYPHSGGIYVFLRETYGRGVSFVFGWTYLLISKPLAAAGIATVMAEHLGMLAGVPMSVQKGDAIVLNGTGQAVICAMLVGLTWLHARGVGLGAMIAAGLTSLKVLALAALVVVALAMRKGDAANFEPVVSEQRWWWAIAPIMAAVLWTYDGWADVGAIAGEIKDPSRTLPRAFIAGTLVIVGVYVAVNMVYIWMVPLDEMRGTPTVAPLIMERLLGPAGGAAGGVAVAGMIALSAFGATHASIMTGARVTYAQAKDGLLFRWLAGVHPKYATPSKSLWAQCVLSCAAVVGLHAFEKFAGGFVFTIWIFYGLAGAAVMIQRRRRPDAPRAFRCVGYPFVPALFVAAAAAMTVLSIVADPVMTAVWLSVLALGAPVYWVWERVRSGRTR